MFFIATNKYLTEPIKDVPIPGTVRVHTCSRPSPALLHLLSYACVRVCVRAGGCVLSVCEFLKLWYNVPCAWSRHGAFATKNPHRQTLPPPLLGCQRSPTLDQDKLPEFAQFANTSKTLSTLLASWITCFLVTCSYVFLLVSPVLYFKVPYSHQTWWSRTMVCMQRWRLDPLDGMAHHGCKTGVVAALFIFPATPSAAISDWIPLPGLSGTAIGW